MIATTPPRQPRTSTPTDQPGTSTTPRQPGASPPCDSTTPTTTNQPATGTPVQSGVQSEGIICSQNNVDVPEVHIPFVVLLTVEIGNIHIYA